MEFVPILTFVLVDSILKEKNVNSQLALEKILQIPKYVLGMGCVPQRIIAHVSQDIMDMIVNSVQRMKVKQLFIHVEITR
jgi:hypothetical protein